MKETARALLRALGPREAARVAALTALRALWDRPFEHLPTARMGRESESRSQARPAVLLYRVLLDRLPAGGALRVASQVIAGAALDHLGATLGDLDPRALALAPEATRRARVRGLLDRFATATATVGETSGDRITFTVTGCALVRLAAAAGHPELATAFCGGDAAFFASRTPPIDLHRPHTIAGGAASCPFTLRSRHSPDG